MPLPAAILGMLERGLERDLRPAAPRDREERLVQAADIDILAIGLVHGGHDVLGQTRQQRRDPVTPQRSMRTPEPANSASNASSSGSSPARASVSAPRGARKLRLP